MPLNASGRVQPPGPPDVSSIPILPAPQTINEEQLAAVFHRFAKSTDHGRAPANSYEECPPPESSPSSRELAANGACLMHHQVINALAWLGLFSSPHRLTAADQRVAMRLWPQLSPRQDGRCYFPDFARVVTNLLNDGKEAGVPIAFSSQNSSLLGSPPGQPAEFVGSKMVSPPRGEKNVDLEMLKGADREGVLFRPPSDARVQIDPSQQERDAGEHRLKVELVELQSKLAMQEQRYGATEAQLRQEQTLRVQAESHASVAAQEAQRAREEAANARSHAESKATEAVMEAQRAREEAAQARAQSVMIEESQRRMREEESRIQADERYRMEERERRHREEEFRRREDDLREKLFQTKKEALEAKSEAEREARMRRDAELERERLRVEASKNEEARREAEAAILRMKEELTEISRRRPASAEPHPQGVYVPVAPRVSTDAGVTLHTSNAPASSERLTPTAPGSQHERLSQYVVDDTPLIPSAVTPPAPPLDGMTSLSRLQPKETKSTIELAQAMQSISMVGSDEGRHEEMARTTRGSGEGRSGYEPARPAGDGRSGYESGRAHADELSRLPAESAYESTRLVEGTSGMEATARSQQEARAEYESGRPPDAPSRHSSARLPPDARSGVEGASRPPTDTYSGHESARHTEGMSGAEHHPARLHPDGRSEYESTRPLDTRSGYESTRPTEGRSEAAFSRPPPDARSGYESTRLHDDRSGYESRPPDARSGYGSTRPPDAPSAHTSTRHPPDVRSDYSTRHPADTRSGYDSTRPLSAPHTVYESTRPPHPDDRSGYESRSRPPDERSAYDSRPPHPDDRSGYESRSRHPDERSAYESRPPPPDDRSGYESRSRHPDTRSAHDSRSHPYPDNRSGYESRSRHPDDRSAYDSRPPHPDDRSGYESRPRHPDDRSAYDSRPPHPDDRSGYESRPRHPDDRSAYDSRSYESRSGVPHHHQYVDERSELRSTRAPHDDRISQHSSRPPSRAETSVAHDAPRTPRESTYHDERSRRSGRSGAPPTRVPTVTGSDGRTDGRGSRAVRSEPSRTRSGRSRTAWDDERTDPRDEESTAGHRTPSREERTTHRSRHDYSTARNSGYPESRDHDEATEGDAWSPARSDQRSTKSTRAPIEAESERDEGWTERTSAARKSSRADTQHGPRDTASRRSRSRGTTARPPSELRGQLTAARSTSRTSRAKSGTSRRTAAQESEAGTRARSGKQTLHSSRPSDVESEGASRTEKTPSGSEAWEDDPGDTDDRRSLVLSGIAQHVSVIDDEIPPPSRSGVSHRTSAAHPPPASDSRLTPRASKAGSHYSSLPATRQSTSRPPRTPTAADGQPVGYVNRNTPTDPVWEEEPGREEKPREADRWKPPSRRPEPAWQEPPHPQGLAPQYCYPSPYSTPQGYGEPVVHATRPPMTPTHATPAMPTPANYREQTNDTLPPGHFSASPSSHAPSGGLAVHTRRNSSTAAPMTAFSCQVTEPESDDEDLSPGHIEVTVRGNHGAAHRLLLDVDCLRRQLEFNSQLKGQSVSPVNGCRPPWGVSDANCSPPMRAYCTAGEALRAPSQSWHAHTEVMGARPPDRQPRQPPPAHWATSPGSSHSPPMTPRGSMKGAPRSPAASYYR